MAAIASMGLNSNKDQITNTKKSGMGSTSRLKMIWLLEKIPWFSQTPVSSKQSFFWYFNFNEFCDTEIIGSWLI